MKMRARIVHQIHMKFDLNETVHIFGMSESEFIHSVRLMNNIFNKRKIKKNTKMGNSVVDFFVVENNFE